MRGLWEIRCSGQSLRLLTSSQPPPFTQGRQIGYKILAPLAKGDSPQCGEMSRSDRGDGRRLGGKRRSRRGDCAGGIGEISQQTKDGRSRPYVFLSILLYWESSIIRSMQRTAFSAISGGTVISWPAVPCRQPSTSPRVVAFILWHTQSLDRG